MRSGGEARLFLKRYFYSILVRAKSNETSPCTNYYCLWKIHPILFQALKTQIPSNVSYVFAGYRGMLVFLSFDFFHSLSAFQNRPSLLKRSTENISYFKILSIMSYTVGCFPRSKMQNFWTITSHQVIRHHSVQFSRSVVSDSLWPHALQHTRPPCPSPTPRGHSFVFII